MTKLYTIYEGKIVEKEARETDKMFIIEDMGPGFYKFRFYKDEVYFSPQEVIQANINSALTRVGMFEYRLKKEECRLSELRKLEKQWFDV